MSSCEKDGLLAASATTLGHTKGVIKYEKSTSWPDSPLYYSTDLACLLQGKKRPRIPARRTKVPGKW
jgi:hypothetical protein